MAIHYDRDPHTPDEYIGNWNQQYVDRRRAKMIAEEIAKNGGPGAEKYYSEKAAQQAAFGSIMDFIFPTNLQYTPTTRLRTLVFIFKALILIAWHALVIYGVDKLVHFIFPITWESTIMSGKHDISLVILFLLTYFFQFGLSLLVLVFDFPPLITALYYLIKGYDPTLDQNKEEKLEVENIQKDDEIKINLDNSNDNVIRKKEKLKPIVEDKNIFKID